MSDDLREAISRAFTDEKFGTDHPECFGNLADIALDAINAAGFVVVRPNIARLGEVEWKHIENQRQWELDHHPETD